MKHTSRSEVGSLSATGTRQLSEQGQLQDTDTESLVNMHARPAGGTVAKNYTFTPKKRKGEKSEHQHNQAQLNQAGDCYCGRGLVCLEKHYRGRRPLIREQL